MNNNSEIRKCLAAISDEVIDNIKNINCGGCAVYAVELAKRMKRLGITDAKLRVYSYQRPTGGQVNVCRIENKVFNNQPPESNQAWVRHDVYFCHVRLEWGGRMWDAEGDAPIRGSNVWNRAYQKHPGHISIKAMNLLASKQGNWNPRFDRNQIPTLRKIMNKHFAKLSEILRTEQLPLAA